jgi:uncharacterized protein YciI
MSAYFAFRLIPQRPTFAQDMSADEAAIMAQHAEHWQPLIDAGKVVVFGPVLDSTGSYGLGLIEADSEEEVQALAQTDPAVTSGLGKYEIGRMLSGFVRGG